MTSDRFPERLQHAHALLQLRRLEEARNAFATLVCERPGDLAATNGLARANYTLGDYLRAYDTAREVLRDRPHDPMALQIAALSAGRLHYGDQSISYANQLVAMYPYRSNSHRILALALLSRSGGGRLTQKRRLEAAREASDRAVQIGPDDADAWLSAAVVETAAGRKHIARRMALQALELDPQSTGAQQLLSNLDFGQKRFASGLSILHVLMRSDPTDDRSRRAFDGRIEEVITDFQWLTLTLNVALYYIVLGTSAESSGDQAGVGVFWVGWLIVKRILRALAVAGLFIRDREVVRELPWRYLRDVTFRRGRIAIRLFAVVFGVAMLALGALLPFGREDAFGSGMLVGVLALLLPWAHQKGEAR